MKKSYFIVLLASLLFVSCAQEFNQVYKSPDYLLKYEYAKELFARGKYNNCIALLQDIVTIQKGKEDGEVGVRGVIFGSLSDDNTGCQTRNDGEGQT